MDKEPEITVRQENSGSQETWKSQNCHNNSVELACHDKQRLNGWNFCSLSTEKMLLF